MEVSDNEEIVSVHQKKKKKKKGGHEWEREK